MDDEKCDRCGARMKLRALVIAPASIERFLRHLGEPVDSPPLAPVRGPPFFRSPAVRRKLPELDGVPRPPLDRDSSAGLCALVHCRGSRDTADPIVLGSSCSAIDDAGCTYDGTIIALSL